MAGETSKPRLGPDPGEETAAGRTHYPTSPIFFDHIPKTAGTSVAQLLTRAYPRDEVMHIDHADKINGADRHIFGHHRCYHGHFGTLLTGILDPAIPTVTLLRDPYDQTISLVKHVLRTTIDTKPAWTRPILARTAHRILPLFVFLAVYPQRHWVQNFQTRWLGVDLDIDSFACTEGGLNKQLQLPESSLPEALEKAKRRLDSMAVVGTVDNIDEFVRNVFNLIGVPAPEAIPHRNVGYGIRPGHSHRQSTWLPQFLVRRIDAIPRYDRELYAYACELARRPVPASRTTEDIHGN